MALEIDYAPHKTGQEFMLSDAKMRVLMGPVGCVSADTVVLTEYGPTPIAHIDRPMRVLSWNEKTCQFQLSWCGGAFPKGKDYLYRVTTPGGEFASSGHHLALTAACGYQQVQSLSPDQSLLLCSDALEQTRALCGPSLSWQGADHLTRTAVDSLARYAGSARQYGQQFLSEEDNDLISSPERAYARQSVWSDGLLAYEQKGDHSALSQEHSQIGQYDDRKQIGGCPCPDGLPHEDAADLVFSEPYSHSGETTQFLQQSELSLESHRTGSGSGRCSSYISYTTNGTILSVSREAVKRSYWDMQVLDTNNYVTIDGAIHHNSGKSVTCCFEIIRRASMQAPGKDGIRRSRWAVVRETVRQLSDTTIKTFLDWFPDGVCGRFMRTTKTYHFKVGDVEAEIMFRALDDADDVANLNSLELTGAWFNECRDIAPEIVDAMSKRIGRYPSKKDGGPTWFGMFADTNPPTMDTWWYYQMEHLDPKDGVSPNDNGWDVFKQPSGRSALAENVENLPEGYYSTQGRSEEYIRVFIDGEYGLSLNGTPVYSGFRSDYHMAKSRLNMIRNGTRPLLVGMDLGLSPAAVIGQQDARGRMLILGEVVGENIGVQRFARTMLKPYLAEHFPGVEPRVIVDPAGIQRAQTDERTAVDILRKEGFKVIPARTNQISARLNAVDDFLMRQVDGDSAFLMDPRCTRLKAAMMGGYHYHIKNGTIVKNQHSHVAEALQYFALHINISADQIQMSSARPVERVDSIGWT